MSSSASPVLLRRLRATAGMASLVAAALALVGLLGWLLDQPVLREFIPGRPGMMPNTAVSILVAALALRLLLPERSGRLERAVGRVFAAVALAVGAATVLQHATGIDVGVDRILLRLVPAPGPAPVVASVGLPGRPALSTSVCLVLVGAALLVLDRRARGPVQPAEGLAVAAALVTHAVLTGHAYDAEALFRHPAAPATGMSLPTGIALALLAWGLLLGRPERGVMAVVTSNLLGGMMARRLLLAALAGPPLLGFVALVFAPAATMASLSLSHAVLATSSAAVAVALTLATASSLNRVDAARRRGEDELRRWHDVAESADEAIIAKTLDGIVTGWNRAAARMFGWRSDEIVGCSILTIVPEDRRAEQEAYRDRLRRGEPVAPLETVRSRKDGSRIDVVISLSPVKDREGRIRGYSAIMRDITERKAAEAARRRLEQQYTELFEQASDGIFLADVDGRYTEVNAAGARLLGCSREDIVGKTILDFIPPEEAPRLTSQREAFLAGTAGVSVWRLRARDGQWIPVEVSAKILPDGRWQGFVRDLRARQAAEAELARAHAAERELRTRLEAMSSAATTVAEAVTQISATGLEGVLQVVAREAQRLTHARYAALGIGTDPGRPFEHWVHEGMAAEQVAAIGRRPRPVGVLGAVVRHRGTIRLADVAASVDHLGFPPGHPRMRSFLGAPVMHGGEILGHIYLADRQDADAFSEDDQRALEFLAARAGTAIETARLYREEALARAWLFAVIDGLPEAVMLADADGRISYNAAAQCFASVEQDAAAGPGTARRLDLRGPGGTPIAWSDLPFARALHAGESSTGVELLARDRDGNDVPVLVSASPLRDGGGAIIGAVCVLRNITPLKELERLREQWTAIVAHDLRQPLSVIAMSAQALARSAPAGAGAAAERALARIQSAADRLQRMVNDLLDASRLDARQLTLERVPVDLGRLLSELAARTDLGDGRRIRLRAEWPLPRVWADPDRIEQVMENLLSNAGKYGDPGSDVVVEARATDGEVVLSTRNRGPDLTPDELAQLFTRFYRTRGAPPAKGLGLGLYIARGLVEAHGGRIWVESADRTTTFRFTLPVAAG